MTPKAAGPKKAAQAAKKAEPDPTIECPKCHTAVTFTEDRKAFNDHLAECGEMVKVVIMATFTVRLEPDKEAQLPRVHATQVSSHAHNAIQGLIKSLKGRPGVREVFVRRT